MTVLSMLVASVECAGDSKLQLILPPLMIHTSKHRVFISCNHFTLWLQLALIVHYFGVTLLPLAEGCGNQLGEAPMLATQYYQRPS